MNIGAIDIGSNALRFAYKKKSEPLEKAEKIRIPLRLGQDVFRYGEIGKANSEYANFIFGELKKIIQAKKIEEISIYATSALRDAKNATSFIDGIKKSSQLKIEVISGEKEAELIRHLIEYEFSIQKRNYLLIDIGGGSLELNLYRNGVFSKALSLDVGTVRMINSGQSYQEKMDSHWPQIKDFLGNHGQNLEFLGTGGNFRQLMKFYGTSTSVGTYDWKSLKKIFEDMQRLNENQRIDKYCLKPDRAQIIQPACFILDYLHKKLKASKLHCCRFGLVQAILLERDHFS